MILKNTRSERRDYAQNVKIWGETRNLLLVRTSYSKAHFFAKHQLYYCQPSCLRSYVKCNQSAHCYVCNESYCKREMHNYGTHFNLNKLLIISKCCKFLCRSSKLISPKGNLHRNSKAALVISPEYSYTAMRKMLSFRTECQKLRGEMPRAPKPHFYKAIW